VHIAHPAVRWVFPALFLLGAFTALDVAAQTLPHLRTTFVPRLLPEPNDCYQFSCFNRASYDGNTLAAIGTLEPVVHVYLRLSSGPWYAQSVRRNRSPLLPGYTSAGYRYPLAVVGNDILVTAYQNGPGVTERCETHVWSRIDTRWHIKQIIDVCAGQFAKDGNRILFGTAGPMPIYARGSDGSFSEESRVFPPIDGFFDAEKSLALHAWTVVVGKPSVNFATGAAYVFQRHSGQWILMETLVPEGAGANTRFGRAVGVYEYNIAVAAPGAVSPSGIGTGQVYVYTGVNDHWFISQEIGEPPPGASEYPVGNTFGISLALRGRRLVVSTTNPFQSGLGPPSYLFERGVRESSWVARATLAGDGLSIDLSGNTAMVDRRGLRSGTFPTVVNLPTLRELDVTP
jgi:hypothetical protein